MIILLLVGYSFAFTRQLSVDLVLGLPTQGDCLAHIKTFALAKIEEIVAEFPVSNLEELRCLVCNRFSLKVELIEADEDIDRIADQYADFHPTLKRQLRLEFLGSECSTEGITLERDGPAMGQFRYLAVIDARGEHSARAYFTTWHEITHLILLPSNLPFSEFYCSPTTQEIKKDPIESVVDHVTGSLAFYSPFFKPILDLTMQTHHGLTFQAIEEARDEAAPTASLLATTIHSLDYATEPTLLVSIELQLKKSEARAIKSSPQRLSLAPLKVKPKPRATMVIANKRAKKGVFEIRRNMRIPQKSVLMEAFESPLDIDLIEQEDQDWWETSQSGHLSSMPIKVQVVRRGSYVYGLLSSLA